MESPSNAFWPGLEITWPFFLMIFLGVPHLAYTPILYRPLVKSQSSNHDFPPRVPEPETRAIIFVIIRANFDQNDT
jgi:hypothetical protein